MYELRWMCSYTMYSSCGLLMVANYVLCADGLYGQRSAFSVQRNYAGEDGGMGGAEDGHNNMR